MMMLEQVTPASALRISLLSTAMGVSPRSESNPTVAGNATEQITCCRPTLVVGMGNGEMSMKEERLIGVLPDPVEHPVDHHVV